jgi:ABC-type transport system substrate-binding protein
MRTRRSKAKILVPVALALTLLLPNVAQALTKPYFLQVQDLYFTGDPAFEKLAIVLQQELAAIGIDMTYQVVDGSVQNQRMWNTAIYHTDANATTNTGYDLWAMTWGDSGEEEASQLVSGFTCAQRWPGGWNIWGYCNEDLDNLSANGTATFNSTQRQQIYDQIQQILVNDLPIIPIAMTKNVLISNANLSNRLTNTLYAMGEGGPAQLQWTNGSKSGGTFTYAYNENIVGLLPWWGNIGEDAISGIWERLATFNNDSQIVPQLASSWNSSANGLVYTFNLVHNATWQDGVPFTAKDVVFSYDGVLNQATGTTMYGEASQYIQNVTAPNNYTVVFHMKTASSAAMADVFANPAMYIVPQHILQNVPYADWKNSTLNTNDPIGTGPYEFVSMAPEQNIVLKANPNYYGGTPYWSKVIAEYIPDAATALAAVQKGQIDTTSEFYDFSQQYSTIANDTNLKIQFAYSPFKIQMGINLYQPGLGNDFVRKAISAAIDRNAIVQSVYSGLAIPLTNTFSIEDQFNNQSISVPQYNLTLAKQYMQEAGYSFALLSSPTPNQGIMGILPYALATLVVGLAGGYLVRRPKREAP